MFTPSTGRCVRRASRETRPTAASAPPLLKPMRFTSARSSMSRKRRGRSLPGCATAVIVPISTWPNPSWPRPRTARPSLSKPAATPNGDGNVRPSASTSSERSGRVNSSTSRPKPRVGSARMTRNARWWASSGSMREKTREKRSRYMPGLRLSEKPRRPTRASLDGTGGQAAVLLAQQVDGRLEVVERLERLVHAREAQVGDLVELAQRRQDREADVVRLDLRRARRADGLLDLLGEHREVGVGDRAPLAGLLHAEHDLLAAERLDDAAALDHGEARGLGRREAAAALGALPTAPDRESVVARAGVDDTGIRVAAERTVHGAPSLAAPSGALADPGGHGLAVRR